MGGCCDSCMKSSGKELWLCFLNCIFIKFVAFLDAPSQRDYTPLVTTENLIPQPIQPIVQENSSRYYQSIIEDAQG